MEKYFKLQSVKHTKREVSFFANRFYYQWIWFLQKNHNKITSERTLLFAEKSILTTGETTIRNEIWKCVIFTHQFTNNFCQIFILNLQTNKNMTFNCTRIKHSYPFQRKHWFTLFNHSLRWIKKREIPQKGFSIRSKLQSFFHFSFFSEIFLLRDFSTKKIMIVPKREQNETSNNTIVDSKYSFYQKEVFHCYIAC